MTIKHMEKAITRAKWHMTEGSMPSGSVVNIRIEKEGRTNPRTPI